MARYTTLATLVDQLRSNLKLSVNPSQNSNVLATHKYALKTAQEFLYQDYSWPFLRGRFDVSLQDGQRYYDIPVDPGRIEKVEYKYNDVWSPLPYGIGGPQLSSQDSDDDERSDPVQRWDHYKGDGTHSQPDQFEVWPIPATDTGTVRFYGVQALGSLVADTDRAKLDDLLVVSMACLDLCAEEERERRLAKFNAYYATLKRRYSGAPVSFVLGGGLGKEYFDPRTIRVAVDTGAP